MRGSRRRRPGEVEDIIPPSADWMREIRTSSLMRPAAPGSLATPATFAAAAAAAATLGHAVPTRVAEASIVGGQLVPVLSGQVVEVVPTLPSRRVNSHRSRSVPFKRAPS